MKRVLYLACIMSVLGAGCIKKGDLDFKNIKVDDWQPDWALPILYSKLTLANVVKPNTTITTDNNGLYSLHYSGDLFYSRASDYVVVPDQLFSTPAITLSVPQSIPGFTASISDSSVSHFTYGDTSGAQLAHINVKSGLITFQVTSTFRQNVVANIVFPSITNGGNPLTINLTLTYPVTNMSITSDLSGYNFDMTNGGTTKNYIPYILRFTVNGTGQPLTPSDYIKASVSTSNVRYSLIDGFMGHFNIPIPNDTIDIGVFNNTLTANVFLRNPRINLQFKNSMGLNVFANFDNVFGIVNNVGPANNMSVPGVLVNGASAPGLTTTTNNTIDTANSSIQHMFNPAPRQVIFNGHVALNPSPATTYNFITDSSYISLNADAELPAWFKIIDFQLQDTLAMSLPTDTSLLRKAEFKLRMENAFGVYGRVQLYFADANYGILDSLVSTPGDIVGEAPVDPYGKVNGNTVAVSKFQMEHSRYNAMAPKVKYAFVRGSLKSSGTGDVKIYSSDYLGVKLAFRFTLDVSNTKL